MLVEEEPKTAVEINPDALEAVFEEDVLVEEDVLMFKDSEEEADEIDIAFAANDEGYW
jgi:hypothetical protein